MNYKPHIMLEKYYNIVSYILFIIAIIICICLLPMVFAAFANPVLLISLFVFACAVIYSFISFRFNRTTVQAKKHSKSSHKAMLHINGFICIFFCMQILLSAYMLFTQPALLQQQVDIFYAQLPNMRNVKMPPKSLLLNIMQIFLVVFYLYAILLLMHVFMSFSLIKKYRDYFNA